MIDALERAHVRVDLEPAAYGSAWRVAGLREASEWDDVEGYAPSPRSTRGATRA